VNGGNTFPGVAQPLGIVKLGPDLYTGGDSYSGYQSNGNFTGFSMLHESGTGGAPKYGVVSQMPVIRPISNPLQDHNDTRAGPDQTEVGYYKSFLGSGILVELAATAKAGLYKYTFPATAAPPGVIVDVSHVLSSYRGQGLEQHFLGGSISVNGNQGDIVSYEGYGEYDNVSPANHLLGVISISIISTTKQPSRIARQQGGYKNSPRLRTSYN
jgi:putative alpha-1,2-mannosidase